MHQQPPPQQEDSQPLDLCLHENNTTPTQATSPTPEVNFTFDEKPDDLDDDQHVPIDRVHEDDDLELPYCSRNIKTPEPEKSEESEIPKIGRGNYFPTYLFENTHAQVVDEIPKYIECFQKYLVQTNNYIKDTHDLRYFIMSTSSKMARKGIQKVGTCHGSWEFQNPYCGFVDTSHDNQPNRVDWLTVKGKKDVKLCSVCKHIAKRQGCQTHKLVEYSPKPILQLFST